MVDRAKSVLYGKDHTAIDMLIEIHAETLTPKILDCTYNTGKMWKGSQFSPIKTDIDTSLKTDVVSDYTAMPFKGGSFDVIVFDPPHLPNAVDSSNSSGIWRDKYGLKKDVNEYRNGDNISDIFIPFLTEAKRVLCPGGIVLAKIADIIHNHRYQWQHVDFINAARDLGMTPCDMLVKTSAASGNLKSSKWMNVYHLKRSHSYWIVVRNANYDERKRK